MIRNDRDDYPERGFSVDHGGRELMTRYGKMINLHIPLFDGKGSKREVFLNLRKFIAAVELTWSVLARERKSDERLFVQLLVTCKLKNEAYNTVPSSAFDRV